VSVEGLKLLVGLSLGIILTVGACDTVGSKVSTFVGIELMVGFGLIEGLPLGKNVFVGMEDGALDGISESLMREVGAIVGIGDTAGTGDIDGAIVDGFGVVVGSAEFGASEGSSEGNRGIGGVGAGDGATSASKAGHGKTRGKPLGWG